MIVSLVTILIAATLLLTKRGEFMALVTAKLDKLLCGWHTTAFVLGHFLLVALGTSLVVAPRTVHAQDILVKRFTDVTGKIKFGQKAQTELVNALTRKGASIRDTKQYLTLAKKKRIPVNTVFLGPNIKKLAKAQNINGVLIGKAMAEKKKYKLSLNVFNQRGILVFKKIFITQHPELTPESADNIIAQIYSRLGIIERPQPTIEQPVITQPTEPEPPAAPTETGVPSWGGKETAAAPVPPPPPPPPPIQVTEPAAKPTEQREQGAVSNVLLAAGAGYNLRRAHLGTLGYILNDRFLKNGFPSFRIDGRFMLGAITDVPFVRDLGVGGSFNLTLGSYHPQEDTTGTIRLDFKQYQWYLDLIYRLAFNSVALKPALLLRFGYGMTICPIENSGKDVTYKYPFAALDIHLMLWNPYLRVFLSPGIMFLVSSEENLVSSGNLGFSILAGLELQLFKYLEIGVGYDYTQFVSNVPEASDVFQTIFIRAGFML
jgi:opacity protein-like surface antigen